MALLAALLTVLKPDPAAADLELCNRTSYLLDTAIALEQEGGVTATRGWFRIDPGMCRTVVEGAASAEPVYVHTRAPAVYGAAPMPQSGHADFCVGDGNFFIASAATCGPEGNQRVARFTAIKPSESSRGLVANLAEEAGYTDEQARLAAIQRLLVMAGYDAKPIDGIEGKKTESALAQFLKDRGVAPDVVSTGGFFDILVNAVAHSSARGFSWCNDTALTVMAAVGIEHAGSVVTRGWYRVEPGRCVSPDLFGRTQRLYSFAEAVDADGQSIGRGDRRHAWGGPTVLCTRATAFELNDQTDCPGRGLMATGFATVELGSAATTVHFRDP